MGRFSRSQRRGRRAGAVVLVTATALGFAWLSAGEALATGRALLAPTPLILKDGRIASVSVHVLRFRQGALEFAEEAANELGELTAEVATDCFLTAQVIGHVGVAEVAASDTLGAHRLARSRADAVQARLIDGGLPANAIASVWDWQFMVRDPRATLWLFRLTKGEDCEGTPLRPGDAALVAQAEPRAVEPGPAAPPAARAEPPAPAQAAAAPAAITLPELEPVAAERPGESTSVAAAEPDRTAPAAATAEPKAAGTATPAGQPRPERAPARVADAAAAEAPVRTEMAAGSRPQAAAQADTGSSGQSRAQSPAAAARAGAETGAGAPPGPPPAEKSTAKPAERGPARPAEESPAPDERPAVVETLPAASPRGPEAADAGARAATRPPEAIRPTVTAAVDPRPAADPGRLASTVVTFANNSSYFPLGTARQLRAMMRELKPGQPYRVRVLVAVSGAKSVTGASTPAEAERYNQWLAERRLERVQTWLSENAGEHQLVVESAFLPNEETRQVTIEVAPAA